MDHTIGLYIVGILALLGGIELVRYSWAESRDEQSGTYGSAYGSGLESQPGHIGVTLGFVLVLFGFVAFYGGYSGWTIMKVLTTVRELAQSYLV